MSKICTSLCHSEPITIAELDATASASNVLAAPIDTHFLSSLIGYNARRASLVLMNVFANAVEGHALKVVEFSMLSLIKANPGITNSALCTVLGLLPPNAVGTIQSLIRQGFVVKRPHLQDGRAYGLFTSEEGYALASTLEERLITAERTRLKHLTAKEQRQLIALLQKTYGG